jgi:hypothetical protein
LKETPETPWKKLNVQRRLVDSKQWNKET